MRLRATAKINLSLEVLGRRPDGYHEVRSVLQAVDLADWVEIEEADALTLRVEPEGAAPAEENLVLRAAELLRGATGATRGAAITLRKQIPVAAGLGGGSSDAAAALLGLSRLWALDLDQAQLGVLAARLGSDVPFFLGGATALASGRGEQLEELPAPVERFAVIVTPTTGWDERKTARMYALLDARAHSDGSRTAETARRIRAGEPVGDALFNVFDEVASTAFGSYEAARSLLMSMHPGPVLLAGSGPSLFVLTDDADAGERVRATMAGHGYAVWITRLLRGRRAGGRIA